MLVDAKVINLDKADHTPNTQSTEKPSTSKYNINANIVDRNKNYDKGM